MDMQITGDIYSVSDEENATNRDYKTKVEDDDNDDGDITTQLTSCLNEQALRDDPYEQEDNPLQQSTMEKEHTSEVIVGTPFSSHYPCGANLRSKLISLLSSSPKERLIFSHPYKSNHHRTRPWNP
jgi:hypothetical protein